MSTVISLANQKGGVAKTVTTYNLAAAKAKEGARVLMIDLDPQASLTISAGIEPGDPDYNGLGTIKLFDWHVDPADCCFTVSKSGLDNLFISPSDIDLAVTERSLVISRNSDIQLSKAIDKLREYFDYIFIDCPPQLGTLLSNALTASDKVIVPVKTEYLAFRGLQALMDTINGVKTGDGDRSLNPQLEVLGIIATMYQTVSKDARDVLQLLQEQYRVLGVVKQTVDVNRKIIDGMPIVLANPLSDVAMVYCNIAKMF